MINLRKIDEENFVDAFNLHLNEGQQVFVSHPVRSLAQAYIYHDQCQPFGIYNDDVMVGYVMVIYDSDVHEYNIWHMMIDQAYQHMGYGRVALDEVFHYIETRPFGKAKRISLTCHKDNLVALQLYKNKGFKESGNMVDDELELYWELDEIHNDICTCQFRGADDLEFQNLFKLYFEELGIKISDWDGVFKEIAGGERTKILLLMKDGEAIGFIIIEPMEMKSWFFTKTEGFIREFYIAKEYRQRGYGSYLLNYAEEYFRQQGIYTITLTTDTADAFYLKHGYIYADDAKAINEDRVFTKHMKMFK